MSARSGTVAAEEIRDSKRWLAVRVCVADLLLGMHCSVPQRHDGRGQEHRLISSHCDIVQAPNSHFEFSWFSPLIRLALAFSPPLTKVRLASNLLLTRASTCAH
jgi:hypothetical protein